MRACHLTPVRPRHNKHFSTPQFPLGNWIVMRSINTVMLHHMWQVIHYTQSSDNVRQRAGARQHWAHPGVMSVLDCGGCPPILHLLPHPIFPSFSPSSPHPIPGKEATGRWEERLLSRRDPARFWYWGSCQELLHPHPHAAVTHHPSSVCSLLLRG